MTSSCLIKSQEPSSQSQSSDSHSTSSNDDVCLSKTRRFRLPFAELLIARHKRPIVIISILLVAVGASLYNSIILSKSRFDIGVPLFAALIYEVTQVMLAIGWITLSKGHSNSNNPRIIPFYQRIEFSRYMKFVLPCGIAAGLNVALSNVSLQLVSLSFYVMVKSSSLLFLLIFAFIFGLEQPSLHLSYIMFLLVTGLTLTVYNPTAFDFTGFALVLMAAMVASFRWALTQMIMKRSNGNGFDENLEMFGSGPTHTIILLGPVIVGTLLMLCLFVEGPTAIAKSIFFREFWGALIAFGLCILGGIQSFVLVVLEYQGVRLTSVLTLFVSGICKEILIIAISVLFLDDHITMINIMGASLSIVGILLYSLYKQRLRRERILAEGHDLEEEILPSLYMGAVEPPWIIEPLGSLEASMHLQEGCLMDKGPKRPIKALVKCKSFLDPIDRPYQATTEPRIYRSISLPRLLQKV